MQISLVEWNQFLGSSYPDAHILQTGEWGELKAGFGWDAVRVSDGTNGAQILYRRLPAGLSIGYLAKGPLGALSPLQAEIDRISAQKRAIFLKWEPDSSEIPGVQSGMNDGDWLSSRPIQTRRTVVISLEGSEEEILSRMKQKTRYNIRLAEKKEVIVAPSSDVRGFHAMALQTARRDGFGVHAYAYYQRAYDLFHPVGRCELFTAVYQGTPLASLFVFASSRTAYYMYGASSDLERNRMPAYLVQWEAMKWAKHAGCTRYDMWGIPDQDEEELEAAFQHKPSHEGLWGVYRFKRGFGGEVLRSVGAWDRVYHKQLYRLYRAIARVRTAEGD